ncbi:MAG: cold shock domain-containing protein [Novosphingobium sp.]
MESPVQIDFRNCDRTGDYRRRIEELVAELESRFGRIVNCRVIMTGPSGHHQTGGHFEVGVHLELPDGHRVDAGRTPPKDERFGDPWFAINDAFKRARRRLQDNVRRMQGKVKQHEQAPIAKVRMVKPEEGYGFLETDDGREIYFHENAILNGEFGRLRPGTLVHFAEEMGEKGPQASTVRLAGKHGMR